MLKSPSSRAVCVCITAFLTMGTTFPVPAHGNGATYGQNAGSIHPIDEPVVRLLSERVVLDMSGGHPGSGPFNARCEYLLHNPSDSARTFTMVFVTDLFPWRHPENPESMRDTTYEAEIVARFRAWQDGKEIRVNARRSRFGEFKSAYGVSSDLLPAWSMTISARSKSTLRMRYLAEWTGGCEADSCTYWIHYFARPADRWSGSVGHASFELWLPARMVRRSRETPPPWDLTIRPGSYRWTSRGLRWEYRDWEPDRDLSVSVSFDGSRGFPLGKD